MPQGATSITRIKKLPPSHDIRLWRWLVRAVWLSVGVLVGAGLVIAQVPGPVDVRAVAAPSPR